MVAQIFFRRSTKASSFDLDKSDLNQRPTWVKCKAGSREASSAGWERFPVACPLSFSEASSHSLNCSLPNFYAKYLNNPQDSQIEICKKSLECIIGPGNQVTRRGLSRSGQGQRRRVLSAHTTPHQITPPSPNLLCSVLLSHHHPSYTLLIPACPPRGPPPRLRPRLHNSPTPADCAVCPAPKKLSSVAPTKSTSPFSRTTPPFLTPDQTPPNTLTMTIQPQQSTSYRTLSLPSLQQPKKPS